MIIRLIGYILIGVGLIGIAAVLYISSSQSRTALTFSPDLVLSSTWSAYKATYLEPGTSRTIDKSQPGDITTSEGESYTMLRAVLENDKRTFDASWTWTKDNLQHTEGDKLFSWRFGRKADGSYGVLASSGGDTSASDADTDIALALLFAYARWQDHQYIGDARVIMTAIWDADVITIHGTPYLTADDKEKGSAAQTAALNPSYLAPAAYHIFAKFDDAHPWDALAESSYDILDRAIAAPLDAGSSAGLPPDWIAIDKSTGALSAIDSTTSTTHFGFDALRVPWRVALDWEWFRDPRAKQTLSQLSFLGAAWESEQRLATTYGHDGSIINPQETPAMYGGTIGYFLVMDPPAAKQVYDMKLASLYDPSTSSWKETLSYYDDNWAWFGIALASGLMPDLTADLPATAFQQ